MVSIIANLILLILSTNNLSIINNPKGTILKMRSVSRTILYEEPILGGSNHLYTTPKIIYPKYNAIITDINVGFLIR